MPLIDHGPFTYLRSKDLRRKLKVLTSEQKQWLGNQILQKITTVTCLHERYSLSRCSWETQNWKNQKREF